MAANFPSWACVCLGMSELLRDSVPFKLEHNEEKDMLNAHTYSTNKLWSNRNLLHKQNELSFL